MKQFAEAEAWRRKWLAVVKERAGADSLPYAGELGALGANLLRQEKWTDAESVLREALAVREKKEPDAWATYHTQSLLGGALLGQKKYAEAEPLLIQGYEGIQGPRGADPGRRTGTAWSRPASGSSGSTRPGAERRRPPNGGRSCRAG